jgi:diaminopimelate decarboxylase
MIKESKKVSHTPMLYFKVQNADLVVNNLTLSQVACIAGQTPFYVYDRSVILEKIRLFREQIPERIHLHYAIKANPHPSLVSFVADQVDGLDIASRGELPVALATKTLPLNISFAGPGKLPREILAAIAAGVVLNIESETELDRALAAGLELGLQPRLAVRVNPDFELKSSGMKMGGGPKQFGIDAEIVPRIIQKIVQSGADFIGLHIFSGSQNLKPEAIIEAHDNTFALAERLAQDSGVSLKKLNIGGGFGIPYFPGEAPLDLEPIGKNLERLIGKYANTFENTELIIELGRYLVGECGLYVASVVDKKVSRGHTYLITDGGLHHHLSNSGNFGQVIRKNYPVAIANRMSSAENELVSVVGPLCTPLDILGDKLELPRAQIGDLVAIYQSGAYGKSASPAAFLSHPDVVELFL